MKMEVEESKGKENKQDMLMCTSREMSCFSNSGRKDRVPPSQLGMHTGVCFSVS